jgi:hypothetical protein
VSPRKRHAPESSAARKLQDAAELTQAMEVFQRLEMKPDYALAKKLYDRLHKP